MRPQISVERKVDSLLNKKDLLGRSIALAHKSILGKEFFWPPFSVLDSRDGQWNNRRKQWDSLGFRSELGRAENLLNFSKAALDAGGARKGGGISNGTGVFDPVLCELAYRWWCPKGGIVLDPFAGGVVRGLVAEICDRRYIGVDLRQEQIDENRKQAELFKLKPKWFCGDSRNWAKVAKHPKGDFIFSSPPYFYREHYSDLPEDLNNAKNYNDFKDGYYEAIASVSSCLSDDRFACFEVAEIRDNKGIAPNFVGDTIDAFAATGLKLYNHAIHIKRFGSAAIRTNMFAASKKLVPVHEHVLVFVKGDPKRAVAACNC